MTNEIFESTDTEIESCGVWGTVMSAERTWNAINWHLQAHAQKLRITYKVLKL
jgi:hypothetical protein